MTYKEFIQNIIDTRGQWGITEGYWEGHHIIPKCKGGSGDARLEHDNVIRLYAYEHYEAHKLLALENPHDWDLVNAFHCISHLCADTNKRVISADEYDEARHIMSECLRGNYPYTIECIDTGELFRCPLEAAQKLGGTSNHIAECCRGKRCSCNGHKFRFFNCNEFSQKQIKPRKYYGTLINDMGPIRCIETGVEYRKVSDAIGNDKLKCARIINCCRGGSCTAYGFSWEFVNEDQKCEKRIDKRFGRRVICIETGVIYNGVADAKRKTGIVNIGKVLKGKRAKAGGYHWEYVI